ncbi:MAG: hypothetical protein ACXWQO_02550 [Bdellovibrionota bacterium]
MKRSYFRDRLRVGIYVKIRRDTEIDLIETFWVMVTSELEPWLVGTIANDLIGSRYVYGQRILFPEDDVLTIMNAEE